MEAESKLFGNF